MAAPALTPSLPPALTLPVQCDNPYDTRYRPERLIIYDKQPGGIGIAQAVGVGGV